MKRALITGITGQDGSYLAEFLDADLAGVDHDVEPGFEHEFCLEHEFARISRNY